MKNSKKAVRPHAMDVNYLEFIFCKRRNSAYQGAWSKSMVGYGSEDDHFVIELTYNYEIGSYKNGNDFVVSLYYM